ncbi:AraC family transcriptional regulator [Metabacillus endolithicus]|uniref:AraC family transcriptional regulator n=1 Tax=Metabacillus endolithicus TaxID=1535204 RepID=A0ABW5C3I6_9BACI|nr:AraC family transcriptional regulator [Metabacillus endolithicus]UPG62472.1 AraC family transcriptional regulator [Metabacillus endolithicus]
MISTNELLSGKTALNKYLHHVSHHEISFHVHYWGVMPNHYNTLFHKHSFYEVCFVVDGEGEYIENDSTFKLQKNKLFLSRPDVLHQIKSENGLFLIYIGFELIESKSSDKWIETMKQIEKCNEIVIDVEEGASFVLLWESLLSQASKSDHLYFEEILVNTAYSLILSILERFSRMVVRSSTKKELEKNTSPILAQAILYIQNNLSDNLKHSDIVKHLHISARHLTRLFVKELGMSYTEYVKNERIQKAALLLKTTNLSIKEISEKTGFKNVHYFTRVFATTVRHPPGIFRMLYTNQEHLTYSENEKPSRPE